MRDEDKREGHPSQGRKYGNGQSHPLPVWSGILEHCSRIGPALWEFLWCIDKITVEDEHGVGWLLGGKPVKVDQLAEDLEEHRDTALDNLNRLEEEGYLIRKRTPRGYVIGVRNSRKFHIWSKKSTRHRANEKEPKSDTEKGPYQSRSDTEKTPLHSESDTEFFRQLYGENSVSKDQDATRQREGGSDGLSSGCVLEKQSVTQHTHTDGSSQVHRAAAEPDRHAEAEKESVCDDDHTYSFQNRKNNPEVLAFARGRILAKAKPQNPGAYLAKAVPAFLDNWQFEIEEWLVEILYEYINRECFKMADSPISMLELKTFCRFMLTGSNLPHDPADPGVFDRAIRRAAGQLDDYLVAHSPLGYVWSEKARKKRDRWKDEPHLPAIRRFALSAPPHREDRMAIHKRLVHNGGPCDCNNPKPPAEALRQYCEEHEVHEVENASFGQFSNRVN